MAGIKLLRARHFRNNIALKLARDGAKLKAPYIETSSLSGRRTLTAAVGSYEF